jgi:hypothetical protein
MISRISADLNATSARTGSEKRAALIPQRAAVTVRNNLEDIDAPMTERGQLTKRGTQTSIEMI